MRKEVGKETQQIVEGVEGMKQAFTVGQKLEMRIRMQIDERTMEPHLEEQEETANIL